MTSGVYQLTFSSGNRYIGKSVNIEERWNQHSDKMRKGTAAKNMQAEFARCGYPTASILFRCHEDHIDIVEACYIARNTPELNTSRPPDPFPWLTDSDDLNDVFNMLGMSTAEHIKQIHDLSAKYLKSQELVADLETLTEELEHKRSKEELTRDTNRRIGTLDKALAIKTSECEALKMQVSRLLNRSWWDRLFN